MTKKTVEKSVSVHLKSVKVEKKGTRFNTEIMNQVNSGCATEIKRLTKPQLYSDGARHRFIRMLEQLKSMTEVLQGLAGRTADTIYDLHFAERKVVAAIVLHPDDLAGMYKPDPFAVFLGGMFRSRQIKIKSERIINERRLAFKNKSIDEILVTHKANIELDYEDIESVAIRKSLLATHLEFITDKQKRRKIFFSLKRNQVPEIEKVISRTFPKIP